MYSQDINAYRQFFIDCWSKRDNPQANIQPLEDMVISILEAHPEYHFLLESVERSFASFNGENPFLHLSLHITIREQCSIDQPIGIKKIYHKLSMKYGDWHLAEHQLMEWLSEALHQQSDDFAKAMQYYQDKITHELHTIL